MASWWGLEVRRGGIGLKRTFVDEVGKPGECLTGGWRSNGHQGQFMVRLWLWHH